MDIFHTTLLVPLMLIYHGRRANQCDVMIRCFFEANLSGKLIPRKCLIQIETKLLFFNRLFKFLKLKLRRHTIFLLQCPLLQQSFHYTYKYW